MEKTEDAFRTISEAASELDVPQHVLRFWETRFTQIRPLKRGGGRRYYRPADMTLLRSIRSLLYNDGYTIKGVQRLLKERGVRAVAESAPAPESNGDLAPLPASFHDSGEDNPEPPTSFTSQTHHLQALRAALADLNSARRGLLAAREH